jgi:hypothetical protein
MGNSLNDDYLVYSSAQPHDILLALVKLRTLGPTVIGCAFDLFKVA